MPVENYGVLKGQPVVGKRENRDKTPHYQILVIDDQDQRFRVPVNVQSGDGSEVLYYIDDRYDHPILGKLEALSEGFHPLPGGDSGLALDYVLGQHLEQDWMTPLPYYGDGPNDDLQDLIDLYVQRAIETPGAQVYAYGACWIGGRQLPIDREFGTRQGVHDIHMNQGNPKGKFAKDNGRYQDGGLLLWYPNTRRWVAIFLAFQTQSWMNDERGNPLTQVAAPGPRREPATVLPYQTIKIIAALINPRNGQEGNETVTLVNTSDQPVVLSGWRLVDRDGTPLELDDLSLEGGAFHTVRLPGDGPRLPNTGGLLTLFDAHGNKMHGVRYSRKDARDPGRTITF